MIHCNIKLNVSEKRFVRVILSRIGEIRSLRHGEKDRGREIGRETEKQRH